MAFQQRIARLPAAVASVAVIVTVRGPDRVLRTGPAAGAGVVVLGALVVEGPDEPGRLRSQVAWPVMTAREPVPGRPLFAGQPGAGPDR